MAISANGCSDRLLCGMLGGGEREGEGTDRGDQSTWLPRILMGVCKADLGGFETFKTMKFLV